MGDIADEHYDAMMDGEECPECGGNWATCECDYSGPRRRRPPPRPETLSMFDNLDQGKRREQKRPDQKRVPRSRHR